MPVGIDQWRAGIALSSSRFQLIALPRVSLVDLVPSVCFVFIYIYLIIGVSEDKAQILTGSQNTRKSSNLTKISQWHPRFKPPEIKSVVCDEIPGTSQKLKWMLKYISYLKYFLINRLQRYPSRVVYMFRQISYLEPELRAFTGQEKVTFLRKFK